MALGHSFEIVIASPDPEDAAQFYLQKNWQPMEMRANSPGIRLTDGLIIVSLERGELGTTKLRYFTESLRDTESRLTEAGITISDGSGTKHFTDPNGLKIELVEEPEQNAVRAPGKAITKFGQFGELSIESDDVKGSFGFWQKLGFAPTQYNPDPVTSWASLSDGLLNFGIYGRGHTKHMFRGAVITYFNEDMAARIQALKDEGVQFSQELDPGEETRSAVLESPHKQMFFLFSY